MFALMKTLQWYATYTNRIEIEVARGENIPEKGRYHENIILLFFRCSAATELENKTFYTGIALKLCLYMIAIQIN